MSASPSGMRLFVAVELPPGIQERLASVQDTLRGAQADVSWVKPVNLHITLKFLGETEAHRLDGIVSVLAQTARHVAPFTLAVAGVGSFGGRIPRVVWAGVSEGAARLQALAAAVENGLVRRGFPRERRGFAAHFTLGRVRSPKNVEHLLAAIRRETATPAGSVSVDHFVLMQSTLDPKGSIYTALERFALEPPEGEGGRKEPQCE